MHRQQSLRKIEQILLRRRESLQSSLRGELGQFNTSHERTVGDDADSAVDTDYGLVNSQLAEAESRELERIEHALAQIRAGQYGVCETCSKRIAMARLQALPYATTCIKCQRATEDAGGPAAGHDSRWTAGPDEDGDDSGSQRDTAHMLD
jgi:DnaK suppressor protein